MESQGLVHPLPVVDFDGTGDGLESLVLVLELDIEVVLVLEDAIDAFGNRVLVTVKLFCHAREHSECLQPRQELATRILASAVGVVYDDNSFRDNPAGHLQSFHRSGMTEIVGKKPAYDVLAEVVRHQAQVDESVRETDVRDVGHENLIRSVHDAIREQIPRDGQGAVPVRRVRNERLASLDKHVVDAQDLEEPISTDFDPGPLQVLADVHAQLAHAATRMIDPCRHDELYDQGLVDGFALADLALLVIGLARTTESPADRHNLHAHRFWELLRHGVCDVIPTAFFL